MSDHRQLMPSPNTGDIEHVHFLSEDIGNLFQNKDCSDIDLVVGDQRFPAHKVILASRCEYFRALLFGGLRESQPGVAEIELQEERPLPFSMLLSYIYTGKVKLKQLKEDQMLELLGMANKYGFPELEAAISDYLRMTLSLRNVCLVYDIANIYSLGKLCDQCLLYMDRNASEVMRTDGFLQMSKNSVVDLLKRSSFCAREVEIFEAAVSWAVKNNEPKIHDVIQAIRLPLMDIQDLLKKVRPTGLVPADALLDAIDKKINSKDTELDYRGILIPEENIASQAHEAVVLKGEMKTALLDGDTCHYDLDRGFTRHGIDDEEGAEGIVVRLGQPAIINTIKMLLWDKDTRSYSYYVEVSMDGKDWVKVVDHSKYLCRSWQRLHFEARVVKFIRVVGTHNTVNRVFHVVAIEAMFTQKPFKLIGNLIVPSENVATEKLSAFVIEGVSRTRNALINGDTTNYDWDSGYTCHQIGSGSIIVQLAQPFIVDSIHLLLWDCDDRTYSYTVEVSVDNSKWQMVKDNSNVPCRSHQTIRFPARAVTFIRIIGTRNTANEVFHLVHIECPAECNANELHSGVNSSPLAVTAAGLEVDNQSVACPLPAAAIDKNGDMWADLTDD